MSDGPAEPGKQGAGEAEASAATGRPSGDRDLVDHHLVHQVEENYREHRRTLWAMFYAVCGDSERAWDAVQQAFLKLQEQNGTPIHDPRAWLLQVGKNWLRDVARRREHAWRAPATQHWDDVADQRLDPAGLAGRSELLLQVRELMDQLRVEDREVLVMRYALSWSSARIAETLGSSVQAIDMRLSRARQRLSVLLTSAGIDAESLD